MVVYAIAGTVIYSVNPKMVLEMAQSIWFITGPSLPIFLLVIAFITALLPRRGYRKGPQQNNGFISGTILNYRLEILIHWRSLPTRFLS
jgi:hypothetical protein